MRRHFTPATHADAPAIAALRNAVAQRLTRDHGQGHWSHQVTERGVLWNLKTSRVFVRRDGRNLVATFRLATKKPWAIDLSYFTAVGKALYLHDVTVDPEAQGRGLGRRLIGEAVAQARAWPADAIRLDAYDSAAGAGPFYAACGFREVGRVTYRDTPLRYFEMLLAGKP